MTSRLIPFMRRCVLTHYDTFGWPCSHGVFPQVKTRACPIARTDLQKILYDGAGHDKVTLNKQVVDYEATDDGITVTFADGSKTAGDFLVIADGTHSRLRNKICGMPIERKYVGYINFNAAIPQSALKVLDLACFHMAVC